MGRLIIADDLAAGRVRRTVTVGARRVEFVEWRPGDKPFAPAFAFDTETKPINKRRPDLVPHYVLGVACAGDRGAFVSSESLPAFWETHARCEWVMHNAPFDLAVTQKLLNASVDVYEAVEDGRVWDTLLLAKLLKLATAGTAKGEGGEFSLAGLAAEYLGVELPKQVAGADGEDVRTGFGKYLHKPVAAIPPDALKYAARDAVATWDLFHALRPRVRAVREERSEVFGDPGDAALAAAWAAYGPLTHHVQLKCAVLCVALKRVGVGVDTDRAVAGRDAATAEIARVREELSGRTFGEANTPFILDGRGSDGSLQALLDDLHARRPDLPKKRTATKKWATGEEALAALSDAEPLLAGLVEFRKLQKLHGTYLAPLAETRGRAHANFWPLKDTGRMSCSKPNLQNLPRGADGLPSVRACLVPRPGHVFLAVDYAQVELCVLGAVLRDQLKLGGSLAELVNDPEVDLHKRIAATVLDKTEKEVLPGERQGAKAVSFGRPGGMGAAALKKQAKEAYGVELTDAEVKARIDAYETLVPELKAYLDDGVDVGARLAERLELTPAAFNAARGESGGDHTPVGWAGGMLMKVLRDAAPATRDGRSYTPEEMNYLWAAVLPLADELPGPLAADLRARKPSRELANGVERLVGRNTVTLTGRFRSNCLFTASRNTLFQGVAADGLILALWDLWRAGYRPVLAIHDEVVLEVAEKDLTKALVADVTGRMEAAMGRVIPGVRVTAKPEVRRSLDKADGFDLPQD
ncbi:DNA polymerase [Alienimonas californiensis]|uniref:DNA polymerase I n=1 Tax=Alienimonas californiensis TaxID=2527989 RepID=A0A517PCU9_9PLAN|nr:DNA polymerase [Alienimonas californiensis]QDT17186.1 DNA polymerase I, thermostable [Alienimonas californiensis]